MRIGLFGGTFDPIHYGHLILAECCREQCRLDRVLFLPAAVPPHKQDRPLTPGAERCALVEAAIDGHPAFAVSRYEVELGGVNYSVNTLRHFRREFPHDRLFFIMGADMLLDLPNWREAASICELATPVVARRAGSPPLNFDALGPVATSAQIEDVRKHQVEMPEIGISSTLVRQCVAAGKSIRYLVPPKVEAMVREDRLYS